MIGLAMAFSEDEAARALRVSLLSGRPLRQSINPVGARFCGTCQRLYDTTSGIEECPDCGGSVASISAEEFYASKVPTAS